jgi:hypothetical protein
MDKNTVKTEINTFEVYLPATVTFEKGDFGFCSNRLLRPMSHKIVILQKLQNKPVVWINRERTEAKFPLTAPDVTTDHASSCAGPAYREF